MSADRLTELRRQRALAQDQLAWFDREIAAITTDGKPAATSAKTVSERSPGEAAISVATAKTPTVPTPVEPTFSTGVTTSSTPNDPDLLLEKYRVAPTVVQQDVRKGCFLYFALAFVLLGVVTVALYIAFRRR